MANTVRSLDQFKHQSNVAKAKWAAWKEKNKTNYEWSSNGNIDIVFNDGYNVLAYDNDSETLYSDIMKFASSMNDTTPAPGSTNEGENDDAKKVRGVNVKFDVDGKETVGVIDDRDPNNQKLCIKTADSLQFFRYPNEVTIVENALNENIATKLKTGDEYEVYVESHSPNWIKAKYNGVNGDSLHEFNGEKAIYTLSDEELPGRVKKDGVILEKKIYEGNKKIEFEGTLTQVQAELAKYSSYEAKILIQKEGFKEMIQGDKAKVEEEIKDRMETLADSKASLIIKANSIKEGNGIGNYPPDRFKNGIMQHPDNFSNPVEGPFGESKDGETTIIVDTVSNDKARATMYDVVNGFDGVTQTDNNGDILISGSKERIDALKSELDKIDGTGYSDKKIVENSNDDDPIDIEPELTKLYGKNIGSNADWYCSTRHISGSTTDAKGGLFICDDEQGAYMLVRRKHNEQTEENTDEILVQDLTTIDSIKTAIDGLNESKINEGMNSNVSDFIISNLETQFQITLDDETKKAVNNLTIDTDVEMGYLVTGDNADYDKITKAIQQNPKLAQWTRDATIGQLSEITEMDEFKKLMKKYQVNEGKDEDSMLSKLNDIVSKLGGDAKITKKPTWGGGNRLLANIKFNGKSHEIYGPKSATNQDSEDEKKNIEAGKDSISYKSETTVDGIANKIKNANESKVIFKSGRFAGKGYYGIIEGKNSLTGNYQMAVYSKHGSKVYEGVFESAILELEAERIDGLDEFERRVKSIDPNYRERTQTPSATNYVGTDGHIIGTWYEFDEYGKFFGAKKIT